MLRRQLRNQLPEELPPSFGGSQDGDVVRMTTYASFTAKGVSALRHIGWAAQHGRTPLHRAWTTLCSRSYWGCNRGRTTSTAMVDAAPYVNVQRSSDPRWMTQPALSGAQGTMTAAVSPNRQVHSLTRAGPDVGDDVVREGRGLT